MKYGANRMKIAFIVNSFPTISETFILNKIIKLIDLGHTIDIYADHKGDDYKIHENVLKYDLSKHTVYIHQIPDGKIARITKGFKLFICNFHKDPKLILNSFNFFKYGFKNAFYLRYFFLTLSFLNKKAQEYDIVNAQFGPNGIIALSLKDLGLIKSNNIVTTFHGYGATVTIQKQGVYKELFSRGNFFIVVSNFVLERILKAGCPKEKTVLLPNEVNINDIKYNENSYNDQGTINILSVGRLVEMKGREYAIKAVTRVINNHPNILYQIAGDGPLKDYLNDLIIKYDVQKNVKILGWVDDKELKRLYKTSHIFLHPSVTTSNGNQECQGMALLEAQAYGLPVIATQHGAFPESVLDGKSGFLVPEKDVDALAEKIEYLIEHHEIWPEMSKAGRVYVEEKYDSEKLLKELEQIYNKLLV